MKIKIYLFFFLFSVLLIATCKGKKEEQKVIATVNDSQISLVELQKEVTAYSNRHPTSKITAQSLAELLKTTIEKKLMIQESMKKGLAEDERFVETIRTFWEQTLIRELIYTKNREWADRLFVTEEEIKDQYNRMQYRPTVKVVRANIAELAEEMKRRMVKGERVEGEETVGPLFYENVTISVLQNAFDMERGEVKIFYSDGEYIIIYVLKKEKTILPPLKDMYGRIKESLLEQKKQKALAEWMEDVKRSSKIHINNQLLKELTHER